VAYFLATPSIFLEGPRGTSLKIVGVRKEIRIEYLPNANQMHHLWSPFVRSVSYDAENKVLRGRQKKEEVREKEKICIMKSSVI
jgi:hypothetical protein